MKNTLKGWLVDNSVTADNKEDKILLLHSAGNASLYDVIDDMIDEATGLKRETITHVVALYHRVVARLLLNGYNVNTGLYRGVAQFTGVVEKGQWNPEKNSVYVSLTQDKEMREAIKDTVVEILGEKSNVMYILGVEDKKTGLTDGTATPGRNFFVRGAMLKIVGEDPACGVTLTPASGGSAIKLEEDLITINKPSELTLLMPADLASGDYTLTVTTQYSSSSKFPLKVPRSVSTSITVPGSGGSDSPDEI
ncbi:MAG: DNA-binding domain-containing protein [Parabacteroides sp.]|nr:DNA-binding domain-containing protein [Parabacteroides sp.]